MAPSRPPYAVVTLLTTDEYLPAALVLAHSFKTVHQSKAAALTDNDALVLNPPQGSDRASNVDLVALVTPATLSIQSIRALVAVYDRVIGVEPLSIDSVLAMQQKGQISANNGTITQGQQVSAQSDVNLALLGRPDLGIGKGAALTKLHAWRLTEYQKILFLDADTLILRPVAHILAGSYNFAASPDIGWPDCFNSGVMVLTPSEATFAAILELAAESGTWDGADQGLLNEFYGGETGTGLQGQGGGWTRLRFAYNTTAIGGYTYAPAFKRYGPSSYIAHFIGDDKPWRLASRPTTSSASATQDSTNLNLRWWSIYNTHYPSPSSTPQRSSAGFEVRFTDRGAEVLQRSAGKDFKVPTYASAWESRGDSRTAKPANVDDLKKMFSGGLNLHDASQVDGEGAYESLPLFGRVHLMAPRFDAEQHARAMQKLASPPEIVIIGSSPQPQSNSPHVHWDATVTSPPHSSGPGSYQMRNPIDTIYENAWDQPHNRRAEEEERQRRLNQWVQPGFIPDEARKIHDFSHLSNKPDANQAYSVFPWEQSAPSSSDANISSSDTARFSSRPAATPSSATVPPPTRRFDDYVTRPTGATSSSAFSDASLVARYTNAWDDDALSHSAADASARRMAKADAKEQAAEARRQGQPSDDAHARSRSGVSSGYEGGHGSGSNHSTTAASSRSKKHASHQSHPSHARHAYIPNHYDDFQPNTLRSTIPANLGGASGSRNKAEKMSRQGSAASRQSEISFDDSLNDVDLAQHLGGNVGGYGEVEGSSSWTSNLIDLVRRGDKAGSSHSQSSLQRRVSGRRHLGSQRHGGEEDDGDDETSAEESDSVWSPGSGDDRRLSATASPVLGQGSLPSSPPTVSISAVPIPGVTTTNRGQREGPGYFKKALRTSHVRSHVTPRSPRPPQTPSLPSFSASESPAAADGSPDHYSPVLDTNRRVSLMRTSSAEGAGARGGNSGGEGVGIGLTWSGAGGAGADVEGGSALPSILAPPPPSNTTSSPSTSLGGGAEVLTGRARIRPEKRG